MICKYCNNEIPDGSQKCPICNKDLITNIKEFTDHNEKMQRINMGAEEQVASIEAQIKIVQASGRLDAAKRKNVHDTQIEESQVNYELAKTGSAAKVVLSDSDKHVDMNNLDVQDRGTDVNHKRVMKDLEEKVRKKELGLNNEDPFSSLDDD